MKKMTNFACSSTVAICHVTLPPLSVPDFYVVWRRRKGGTLLILPWAWFNLFSSPWSKTNGKTLDHAPIKVTLEDRRTVHHLLEKNYIEQNQWRNGLSERQSFFFSPPYVPTTEFLRDRSCHLLIIHCKKTMCFF